MIDLDAVLLGHPEAAPKLRPGGAHADRASDLYAVSAEDHDWAGAGGPMWTCMEGAQIIHRFRAEEESFADGSMQC